MSKEKWSETNIDDQSGKVFLITGANSGLGLEAARILARKNATVVMACRNKEKAEQAQKDILDACPQAKTEILLMDLADLSSIESAAHEFKSNYDRLDVLLNNAGIMFTEFRKTADGFESQLGTNHFGHFALTGHLLPLLNKTPMSRVVNVSSLGHRPGRMDFDNLNWEKNYNRFQAYFRSKLANLYFTYELQRWLEKSGSSTISVAAHPGGSSTNLGHIDKGERYWLFYRALKPLSDLVTQSAAMGTLPSLRAAVDPNVKGGDYYGPGGWFESSGYPVLVDSTRYSKREDIAKKLWDISEQLTQVHYSLEEGGEAMTLRNA